jgi:hypothetical protein
MRFAFFPGGEEDMNSLEVEEQVPVTTTGIGKNKRLTYVLLICVAFYIVASIYFISDTRSRLGSVIAAQNTAIAKLQQHQTATDGALKISNDNFTQQLGMTERQLQAIYMGTAAEMRLHQQAFERRVQNQQNELIGQVSNEVADVRTELGGAKKDIAVTRTDLASTRTDLESTKMRLDRAIGDLTGQSSLIARTRDDLEQLKHRGDRNYYEFTLYKSKQATQVSTIALQLKKTDPKKNKFTLNVNADDRVIEKKDRGVAEPLQFYSGRDRLLYEVVIFTVEKNKVTGYLSTPKSPGTLAAGY